MHVSIFSINWHTDTSYDNNYCGWPAHAIETELVCVNHCQNDLGSNSGFDAKCNPDLVPLHMLSDHK